MTCCVEGCPRGAHARGLCSKHYMRFEIRRRGARGERQKDIAATFNISVSQVGLIIRRKQWTRS